VNGGYGYSGTGTFEEDRYFYHHDHLGSSSYLTNQLGNITQHVEYIPFGEVFVEERNEKWNTPYKFNGKEVDEETGLYYYGARYYSSKESVWLSVDPLAEKYPDWSPYAYTFQNPVKFIDPIEMEGEDTGGDPPKGKRDIYESRPADGGRKLVKTKTVSSGSDKDSHFVSVLDEDGNTLKAYSGANAVAEYTRDYGIYKEFESIASDGKGDFERAFWATKEVIKIAATSQETQPILLMPLGALADILLASSVARIGVAAKGGVQITKHAAERMVERGITQKMVETGIAKGTKYLDPKNGTFNYVLKNGFASGKDLLIGVSPQTGKVTTVLRGNNLVNKRFIPQ
jgi:RHS repeat-associated protein